MQTASATRCATWCIYVSGLGLHVDTFTINRSSHSAFSGYPYIEVVPPSATPYFIWGVHVSNVKQYSGTVEKSFPNHTTLCGGVAPTKVGLDYVGSACIEVHD